MKIVLALTITFSCVLAINALHSLHPLSDEFIDLINSKQSTWIAGRNFPANTSMITIKILLGAHTDVDRFKRLEIRTHEQQVISSLPENFDPREKWPNCPTLNDIRDQGCCGSCWAFGAVTAMTDRVCIFSKGSQNFYFSAQDLVSCSPENGCSGGSLEPAWSFWNEHGIVSGGAYGSSLGCRPYEVAEYKQEEPCVDFVETPKCMPSCPNKDYKVSYEMDKHYGKAPYTISGEDNIKAELYTNGPVEVSFDVYEDFIHYKTGVYQYKQGKLLGGHAVKLLGWGVENGVKYWLLANSWNTKWGDQGFFKFLRGSNNCQIEAEVVGGEPKL